MYFENSSKVFMMAEVICPRPCRAVRIPIFNEGPEKLCPRSMSNLPKKKEGSSFNFLDMILNKDDQDGDLYEGAQMVFFCGSPPVRSHNPMVHDAQFTKQTMPIVVSPSLTNSFGVGNSCGRVDRGSLTCSPFSGSPKVRIEGFDCRKSDSRTAVSASA